MKKSVLFLTAFVLGLGASEGFEKSGFLTTEACAKAGAFTDCYLENYACEGNGCYRTTEPGVDEKTPLVLYSHDDGVIYRLDISALPRSRFDAGVNRNGVIVFGEFDADSNTIIVNEIKSPPPPKKSFFKGCL